MLFAVCIYRYVITLDLRSKYDVLGHYFRFAVQILANPRKYDITLLCIPQLYCMQAFNFECHQRSLKALWFLHNHATFVSIYVGGSAVCLLFYVFSVFGIACTKVTFFSFVGLRYSWENFKVWRTGKKKKNWTWTKVVQNCRLYFHQTCRSGWRCISAQKIN